MTRTSDSPFLMQSPKAVEIDLILLPETCGHGVGRAAVAELVHRARRERGWSRVIVDPDCANESGIRFWEAVGFVTDRVVADELGRRPCLVMVLTT